MTVATDLLRKLRSQSVTIITSRQDRDETRHSWEIENGPEESGPPRLTGRKQGSEGQNTIEKPDSEDDS